MLRSQINTAYQQAVATFTEGGWALLPHFQWDITDFGLGQFDTAGLVLINLCAEPEYCEKLMFARQQQQTPAHYHRQKKEDIICRRGQLAIQVWPPGSKPLPASMAGVKINGAEKEIPGGETLLLQAGERITLLPGVWHAFWPVSDTCIIGEVSTANDDANDNFFDNPDIGRFPHIEEDETPLVKLLSEKA